MVHCAYRRVDVREYLAQQAEVLAVAGDQVRVGAAVGVGTAGAGVAPRAAVSRRW